MWVDRLRRFRVLAVVIAWGGLTGGGVVSAQPAASGPILRSKSPSAEASKPRSTIVEIKLLTGADGGGLYSQQWARLFEPLDVSIQILRPTAAEKPEIRDRDVGTIRYVSVVGTLDRAGKISFPGRTFELTDGAKLREWITELKTYGAQGSPEGQPLWGLTREQFTRLYDSLLKPVDADVRDLPIREAISKLPLPAQYPVRWSPAAVDLLTLPGARIRSRQDVRRFSAATALAIGLNDCRLGFRPNRTASDGLELVIEPLGQRKDMWPIGWPLQQQRIKAAPKFFTMTPIELNQVNLMDLLPTVAELTETPILLDYYEIDQKKIDLDNLVVSIKRQQTSWSVALKTMVIPKKLSREIWQDEAGTTFVWITTNRPGRSGAPAE